jgi:multidrug efflux system membrane fusion protein
MIAVFLIVVLGGGGLYLRTRQVSAKAAASAASASASASDRPVPVVVAKVEKKDMPIYLDGLGSVTPLQTVTVKSQVDGRLDKVMFKEGQFVKKGEQIAQIDPRPFTVQLHAAEAAVERDKATLANAKVNLDRYTSLASQKLIPQQQADDQKAQVATSAATVAGDQASVDNARLQLDFARITSPIDGVTGVRLVDPGNIVHAADQGGIVVLTQLDPIAVLFTLPEDDLPRVAKQLDMGKVIVEAWNRDGTKKLGQGEVALIDNQINQATATIRLKATFPNPDKALWPNLFVKARLLLTTQKDALVVPASVVQRGPKGTFAYVVGADQKVSMKPVQLTLIQGEEAIITGLDAGESVVADGQNQLRPGSRVASKPPEKSRQTPASSTEGPASPPAGNARSPGATSP